jgi:tol-pal system beta propeller repeat protein TolB
MRHTFTVLFLFLATRIPDAAAVQCPIPNCPPDQLCFCPPPPPHFMVLENKGTEKTRARIEPHLLRVRGNLRLTAMFTFQEKFAPKGEPANKPEDQIPRWSAVSFEATEQPGELHLLVRLGERSPARGVKRVELWTTTLVIPDKLDALGQGRLLDAMSNDLMKILIKRKFAAFGTRMAYVEKQGPGRSVIRLSTVDGGAAGKPVGQGLLAGFDLSINKSPVWSPDRRFLLFTSHVRHNQDLYLVPADLSRPPHRISAQVGMNHSPTFTPDGKMIALTMDHAGSPDVFVLRADWETTRKWRIVRQLTTHHDIDTSAAFSPDGQRVAFVSARNGRAQIHIMNADGSDQRLLLSTPNRTFTPRWCRSGDREYLAFTQLVGNASVIFVYNVATAQGWQVTPAGGPDAENPTWSPHCNLIAYDSQGAGESTPAGIYISPLVGGAAALLYPGRGAMPAWEPVAGE